MSMDDAPRQLDSLIQFGDRRAFRTSAVVARLDRQQFAAVDESYP
jgi:hypothetical protein